MRENCTYGSMRGSRRKTAKSVLRVVEDRAGVPDNKGRPALLYTLFDMFSTSKPCLSDLTHLIVQLSNSSICHIDIHRIVIYNIVYQEKGDRRHGGVQVRMYR